jgi:hypothetical protein
MMSPQLPTSFQPRAPGVHSDDIMMAKAYSVPAACRGITSAIHVAAPSRGYGSGSVVVPVIKGSHAITWMAAAWAMVTGTRSTKVSSTGVDRRLWAGVRIAVMAFRREGLR